MTKLADLRILALDCQTTGANPLKGHLLEIAWFPARASQPWTPAISALQSYLVCLPDKAAIPPAVQRIIGISDQTLSAASPSYMIWQHLLKPQMRHRALPTKPMHCKTARQLNSFGPRKQLQAASRKW
jgi:DNA polymerase III epsilon subunit-like protein